MLKFWNTEDYIQFVVKIAFNFYTPHEFLQFFFYNFDRIFYTYSCFWEDKSKKLCLIFWSGNTNLQDTGVWVDPGGDRCV